MMRISGGFAHANFHAALITSSTSKLLKSDALNQHLSSISISNDDTHHPFPCSTRPIPPICRKRVKNAAKVQTRHRLPHVLASNGGSSTGDSVQDGVDDGPETAQGQGPPFLTILAGVVVFLLVCWLVGSILTGLIGLILRLFSSSN
ncbi:hypothetical protein RJ641_036575 [Dillenia turbinata]|uniref:Uncharacterized protein n=1 Tax=Dillenia turbinata TaxID=194707 RepID=A0AAN8VPH6_9MAGN